MATYENARVIGLTRRQTLLRWRFLYRMPATRATVGAGLLLAGVEVRASCAGGVPVTLPAAWAAFALPQGFICPMCAQLALARGLPAVFVAGRLLIGGRVLMGRAGGVFAFGSAVTADRWVSINRDRAALELEALAKLSAVEAVAWRAARVEVLTDYAAAIVNRVAGEADAMKREALLAESNFARMKWA